MWKVKHFSHSTKETFMVWIFLIFIWWLNFFFIFAIIFFSVFAHLSLIAPFILLSSSLFPKPDLIPLSFYLPPLCTTISLPQATTPRYYHHLSTITSPRRRPLPLFLHLLSQTMDHVIADLIGWLPSSEQRNPFRYVSQHHIWFNWNKSKWIPWFQWLPCISARLTTTS